MLKLLAKPQFLTRVEVHTAAIQGDFSMMAYAYRTSELKALEDRTQQDGSGVAGFLKEVVASVAEVELPDASLPKTLPDAIDALCDYPGVGVAMQRAYYRGLWEEQAKN